MDKRSWPWRKKPSDKNLTSTESGESSPVQTLRQFDDQIIPGLTLDHSRISDMTMSQHQADEKIRHLNERLLAADDLVKQHVKVAEEAVSGWEKAKAEYVSVKHQLDAVVEQKRATEDRVSHLDGALKECMWQLRHSREEQEQKIHEAIIKKTRDWEKCRLGLEERLAHADQQLVEAGYQNTLLHKTVQEQAEVVAGLGQAHSQAEAEIETLQVRIETFEKENASLKYEVIVLNKELEIRNQEREINKRSTDVASRQHLEGIKKINKLEAECQRLRVLVRKKLPGPGALVQMKMEVEELDAEKGEFSNKWRSGSKAASSPKAAHAESMLKSESILSERLLTMEEETKMLKEALAKRNSELQTARLMCARTADKLSTLEGQVGHFQNSPRIPLIGRGLDAAEDSISLSIRKESSQASMSEDGNDDERSVAESWASALISELAHFQKEKAIQQQANKVQHSHKVMERLDSIDDFIEIERLVALPSEPQGVELNTKAEPSPSSISEQVLAKEAELQAANMLCAEVNNKLVVAEEQLSLLRSKNTANELNLFSLQQKLNMILEAPERGDPEKVLEDVKNAVLASRRSSVDGLQAHVMKLSKVSSPGDSSDTSPSLKTSPHHESSLSKCDGGDRIFKIGPELTSAVCKVVRLVEDLASEGMAQHLTATCPKDCQHNGVDPDGSHCNTHSTSKHRPLELDTSIRNFITVSNQFLHGKVELVQFIAELSSVLSQIKKLDLPVAYSSLASRVKQRPEVVQVAEQEVFSDAGSPFSTTSNSDGSDQIAAKVLPSDERVSNSKGPQIDEDLQKVRAEKAALESHMRAEFSRIATVEQTLAELKQEKFKLEKTLEEEKEKLETMKSQLLDAEQLVTNLRVRLASAELSRNFADEHLSSTTAVNAKLESQLKDSQLELVQMHEKLKSLEKSINQEHARNEELQAKVEELQELQMASSSGLQGGTALDAERSIKEQEIVDATEKLAECQRTILVLGKHLKDIASAQDPLSISFNSSVDQIQEQSQRAEPGKNININSTLQKVKQRVPSDPGNCRISDVTDEELITAAKGGGHSSAKKTSDLFSGSSPTHEDYIRVVSQMPSSPDAETDTKLVKYVPKPASKKKSSRPFSAIDLSKSLNLGLSSSPQKHGSSFSRFFSRHKKAS